MYALGLNRNEHHIKQIWVHNEINKYTYTMFYHVEVTKMNGPGANNNNSRARLPMLHAHHLNTLSTRLGRPHGVYIGE
jgi:hypothetical protein